MDRSSDRSPCLPLGSGSLVDRGRDRGACVLARSALHKGLPVKAGGEARLGYDLPV
jgi:hypothetical protein